MYTLYNVIVSETHISYSVFCFDEHFYLVEPKLSIISFRPREIIYPVAFEVGGSEQHQPGQFIQIMFIHHLCDVTWWPK